MKKIILITLLAFLMLTQVSCKHAETEAGDLSVIGIRGGSYIYSFIDPDTKVGYFVVDRPSGGTAICPRYNADGTLFVQYGDTK